MPVDEMAACWVGPKGAPTDASMVVGTAVRMVDCWEILLVDVLVDLLDVR